ncbi:hypothetical protein MTR67_025375 [Solanum verrucosum]|uniref:Uncharacterized protein n=1 Tax=Solanum verrucosum TaxID=315347 RepID=A0AAF0TYT0_SOLVR|nr:hypothetical protein MTR67_025375 [Solanum verrucosum]
MDCVCSYSKISLPQFRQFSSFNLQSNTLFKSKKKKNPLSIVASCCSDNNNNNNNNGDENRMFNGLTAPLVPTTEAGRLLSGYMQKEKELFYEFVEKELEKLEYMRKEALLRCVFSVDTDEVILHRRICEMKKVECQKVVEDVMYMFIVYKFSEIGVHMVPKLSNCMYNGRLEISPCKNWELESIHSVEVLEMVKEIGWEDKWNVKDNWGLTQVKKDYIRYVYGSSMLYGYFFKSASLRYHLEKSFDTTSSNLSFSSSCHLKQKSVPTGSTSVSGKKYDNFRSYVANFDNEIMKMCRKPKFNVTVSLMEKHCSALFGDENQHEEVSTSFASLKRFVLEAVAFGSFLWDAEYHFRKFYRLEEYRSYFY